MKVTKEQAAKTLKALLYEKSFYERALRQRIMLAGGLGIERSKARKKLLSYWRRFEND